MAIANLPGGIHQIGFRHPVDPPVNRHPATFIDATWTAPLSARSLITGCSTRHGKHQEANTLTK